MNWIGWLIVVLPLIAILWAACHAQRYVRGVADYLAAGRVAGRYVISVGDLQAGLAVITLVALCEQEYQCGMAMGLWSKLTIPVSIFMSLTGYCVYRYRQTRCLSIGQFLEMRYNRAFRVIAATIRTIAEMITNAIAPAIAARFFIYFLGFPHSVTIWGMTIPTFMIVVIVVVTLATIVILPGGRVSLIITDCFQGLIGYPIFVIFTVFVLSNISWVDDIAPVMLDRAPGESFLNPMDLHKLRDFNIFSLVVTIVGSILNRASWIGNDTTSAGRTPHEQKMAGVLGTWRTGFSMLMCTLIALTVVVIMLSNHFREEARDVRVELANRVATEIIPDQAVREKLARHYEAIPVATHVIGVDKPYSRTENPDTPYLKGTYNLLRDTVEDGPAVFQKFRTLYYQMMMPVLLRSFLPSALMGLFTLLMIMLMLSTDDSRIFNASSTIVQDVIMPFRKKAFTPREHLWWLRGVTIAVGVFFVFVSLFMSQLDYINMFIQIMCSLWLGAAGPIMIGGLYTRFGTTTGAFCALFFGSGISLAGLLLQRNWADLIYPWLDEMGYVASVAEFLETASGPFHPYIVWTMSDVKFPINSYEIYFIAMITGCVAYLIGSFLTCRRPFNLDRMLHRGKYSLDGEQQHHEAWTWRNAFSKLIGITDEYTTGDKVIAWSVFGYTIVYQFIIAFVFVIIWNMFWPWPPEWWSIYFYFNTIILGVIVGIISTVWFFWGGVVDLKRLFHDLAARVENPLDDGRVSGHVSVVDLAHVERAENKNSDN